MSEISKGYIYVRKHHAYDLYDAVKLGKTCNIVERDATYVTGEIIRGIFLLVIEVDLRDMDNIEDLLKLEFKKWNIYKNGGTEFFNNHIVNLICPCLDEYRIGYRMLSQEEIDRFPRKYKTIDQYNKDMTVSDVLAKIKSRNPICPAPRPDQKKPIVDKVSHFHTQSKGMVLICGVGKTINVPIPSLNKKREIVDYCHHNVGLIKQPEDEIEVHKG
jgi:hypothetical protein